MYTIINNAAHKTEGCNGPRSEGGLFCGLLLSHKASS